MRSAATALIGALALAAAAQPAASQTAADKADARCILVLQLAARGDAKNKEPAVQGTFYYLGRLMAHGLSGKLEPLLLNEGKAITTGAAVQGELTRCGAELTAKSAELRTVFVNLQQAAAAAPKTATPPPK
jgi:hypothetical protein